MTDPLFLVTSLSPPHHFAPHHFSRTHCYSPLVDKVIVECGFCIEARENEEMPETLLGISLCDRINGDAAPELRLDLEPVVSQYASDFFAWDLDPSLRPAEKIPPWVPVMPVTEEPGETDTSVLVEYYAASNETVNAALAEAVTEAVHDSDDDEYLDCIDDPVLLAAVDAEGELHRKEHEHEAQLHHETGQQLEKGTRQQHQLQQHPNGIVPVPAPITPTAARAVASGSSQSASASSSPTSAARSLHHPQQQQSQQLLPRTATTALYKQAASAPPAESNAGASTGRVLVAVSSSAPQAVPPSSPNLKPRALRRAEQEAARAASKAVAAEKAALAKAAAADRALEKATAARAAAEQKAAQLQAARAARDAAVVAKKATAAASGSPSIQKVMPVAAAAVDAAAPPQLPPTARSLPDGGSNAGPRGPVPPLTGVISSALPPAVLRHSPATAAPPAGASGPTIVRGFVPLRRNSYSLPNTPLAHVPQSPLGGATQRTTPAPDPRSPSPTESILSSAAITSNSGRRRIKIEVTSHLTASLVERAWARKSIETGGGGNGGSARSAPESSVTPAPVVVGISEASDDPDQQQQQSQQQQPPQQQLQHLQHLAIKNSKAPATSAADAVLHSDTLQLQPGQRSRAGTGVTSIDEEFFDAESNA